MQIFSEAFETVDFCVSAPVSVGASTGHILELTYEFYIKGKLINPYASGISRENFMKFAI